MIPLQTMASPQSLFFPDEQIDAVAEVLAQTRMELRAIRPPRQRRSSA
jgi:hypothetical protein